MAGYSLLLAQLTSVGLPVAIAAGWRWPAAWLWGWTDPVYYLLGVIGVILLFVSSERERTIADLRVRLERVAADQQQYDATPMQAIGETGSFFLKTAYEGIHVFEELGKVCQDSHLSDGRCIEADGLKDAIDGAYMGFTLPSASAPREEVEVTLLDFCKRGHELLAALSRSDPAYKDVGASLEKLSGLKLQPMEWERSDKERDALHQRLLGERDQLMLRSPEDQRTFVADIWEEKIGFADRLDWALSICLRIPKDSKERIQALQRRQQAGLDLQRQKSELEARIADLTGGRAGNPILGTFYDFLWRQFWPFVLVGALCLKLAKAIAALTPKPVPPPEEAPPPPGRAPGSV